MRRGTRSTHRNIGRYKGLFLSGSSAAMKVAELGAKMEFDLYARLRR